MYNIYILCTDENIFHPRMFDGILKEASVTVVGCGIITKVPKSQNLFNTVRRIVGFDGCAAIPRLACRVVKANINSFIKPCKYPRTTEKVFKNHGIEIDRFENPNDPQCVGRIRQLGVDVVFNNQPWLLKEEILNAPTVMCLNRHTSLLPLYRGVEPVFHALLNGESNIGVSYHSMTSEFDCGRVYAQACFPRRSTVYDCYEDAFVMSVPLFATAISNIEKNYVLTEISADKTVYYRKPTKEQIMSFRRSGMRYV